MNNMHKTAIVLIALIGFVASASAVSISSLSFEPNEPTYNDTVDVVAFIDGEGRDITDVELDVRENNELIVEDENMDYETGNEQDISEWRENEAFTVPENDSETYEYDITVDATDDQGDTTDLSATVTVSPDETEVDVGDEKSDETHILGFPLVDILIAMAIAGFGYVIFVRD